MARGWVILLVIVGVVIAGECSSRAWSLARKAVPELRRADLELTAGQGAALGLLGGFRPLIADLTWIRGYILWERKDRGSEAHLRVACLLSPQSNTFWGQRANMVGLDMAHWEVRARGGRNVPVPIQETIFKRYAQKALDGIEEGVPVVRNPGSLLALGGYLAETKLKDPLIGADYYLRSYRKAPFPWYAPYFHARLLKDGGKVREAYVFLRPVWEKELSKKPDGSPLELDFLRELERTLGVPMKERIPTQTFESPFPNTK